MLLWVIINAVTVRIVHYLFLDLQKSFDRISCKAFLMLIIFGEQRFLIAPQCGLMGAVRIGWVWATKPISYVGARHQVSIICVCPGVINSDSPRRWPILLMKRWTDKHLLISYVFKGILSLVSSIFLCLLPKAIHVPWLTHLKLPNYLHEVQLWIAKAWIGLITNVCRKQALVCPPPWRSLAFYPCHDKTCAVSRWQEPYTLRTSLEHPLLRRIICDCVVCVEIIIIDVFGAMVTKVRSLRWKK